MDIIAIQTANKVLKAMNTRYNGSYEVLVATEGQKDFTTNKAHDITKNTLQVFVNGFHAVVEEDYTHTDEKNFSFKKPLRAGDVVLAMTQVAGVPVYEGTPYDDTAVKELVQALTEKVEGIITAIDEDGDGSITDTIADIKKQWADADESLKTLIEAKTTTTYVDAEVKKVKDSLVDLATAESVTQLTQKVDEVSANAQAPKLIDANSGRPYTLKVSDGTLLVAQVGSNAALTINAPASYTTGEEAEFIIDVVAGCDAGQAVTVGFTLTNCTIKVNDADVTSLDVTELADDTINLKVTPTAAGDVTIAVSVKRQSNQYELATATSTKQAADPVQP